MNKLAIFGGSPTHKKDWPKWPYSSLELEKEVLTCLRSNRWTISGFFNGKQSYEDKFSKSFAAFNEIKYCIPTANGTSALICALRALNIGQGDEVIVPGLTWVACLTAVHEVNGIPILVDVDYDTLCISPKEIRKAITEKTKAIMVVHLYSSVADMSEIMRISDEFNIPIIEDCAQAHGAIWNNKKVGTIGKVGTFSMQQGKVLTSGEGGACITNDYKIAERIYTLRTNGRKKIISSIKKGYMELSDVEHLDGQNFCLSEIQCAILLHQLEKLEEENKRRYQNKKYLANLLKEIEGVSIQKTSNGTVQTTTYHLPIRIDINAFNNANMDFICEALSSELNIWIHKPYQPLNNFYNQAKSTKSFLNSMKNNSSLLKNSWKAYSTYFLLHHSMLLGDKEDMNAIAASIKKVKEFIMRNNHDTNK